MRLIGSKYNKWVSRYEGEDIVFVELEGCNVIMGGAKVDGLYGKCMGSDLYKLGVLYDHLSEYKGKDYIEWSYLSGIKVCG